MSTRPLDLAIPAQSTPGAADAPAAAGHGLPATGTALGTQWFHDLNRGSALPIQANASRFAPGTAIDGIVDRILSDLGLDPEHAGRR